MTGGSKRDPSISIALEGKVPTNKQEETEDSILDSI